MDMKLVAGTIRDLRAQSQRVAQVLVYAKLPDHIVPATSFMSMWI